MVHDGLGVPSARLTAWQAVTETDADAGLGGDRAVLQRVCRGASTALSVRGSAIHLVGSDGSTAVAASANPWSAQVAGISGITGEGPGLDAASTRRPVLIDDLVREAHRWPGFSQAAGEVGLRAIFSFPLLLGGITLGVLELLSGRVRAMAVEEAAVALAFTELTTSLLIGGDVGEDWGRLVDHRAEVHQAQGMVMIDLGVDLAEALLRMRAHAFAEGIALIDLAHAIIAGFVLPAAGLAGPRLNDDERG